MSPSYGCVLRSPRPRGIACSYKHKHSSPRELRRPGGHQTGRLGSPILFQCSLSYLTFHVCSSQVTVNGRTNSKAQMGNVLDYYTVSACLALVRPTVPGPILSHANRPRMDTNSAIAAKSSMWQQILRDFYRRCERSRTMYVGPASMDECPASRKSLQQQAFDAVLSSKRTLTVLESGLTGGLKQPERMLSSKRGAPATHSCSSSSLMHFVKIRIAQSWPAGSLWSKIMRSCPRYLLAT